MKRSMLALSILAMMAVVGTTAANAKSCSDRLATCQQTCKNNGWNGGCPSRCADKHPICMKTGVWPGTTEKSERR